MNQTAFDLDDATPLSSYAVCQRVLCVIICIAELRSVTLVALAK